MHFPVARCTILMGPHSGLTMLPKGHTGTGAFTSAPREGKDTGASTAGMAHAATEAADISVNTRTSSFSLLFHDYLIIYCCWVNCLPPLSGGQDSCCLFNKFHNGSATILSFSTRCFGQIVLLFILYFGYITQLTLT